MRQNQATATLDALTAAMPRRLAAARQPYWMTGALLTMIPSLPVAGILLMAQVLPQIEAAFAAAPGARVLVPVALAVPSLMVGLFSFAAGWLADRAGRTKLLVVSLALFGLAGMAPAFLTDLHEIIAARALMGLADAGIMTASAALLGDYYAGPARARWLSLRTSVTSVSAVGFAALGGYLGEVSWRAPFWCFGGAFVFCAVSAMALRDRPEMRRAKHETRAAPEKLPWRRLILPCLLAIVLAFGIYTTQIELPLLMRHIGVMAPHRIGMAGAFTHCGTMLGTIAFGFTASLDRGRYSHLFNIVITLAVALGLATLGLAGSYSALAAGGFVACFGGGIGLPCMLNRVMRALMMDQCGTGVGIWESCFNISVFFVPLIILALAARTGGLPHGVTLVSAICGLTALVQIIVLAAQVRRSFTAAAIY